MNDDMTTRYADTIDYTPKRSDAWNADVTVCMLLATLMETFCTDILTVPQSHADQRGSWERECNRAAAQLRAYVDEDEWPRSPTVTMGAQHALRWIAQYLPSLWS